MPTLILKNTIGTLASSQCIASNEGDNIFSEMHIVFKVNITLSSRKSINCKEIKDLSNEKNQGTRQFGRIKQKNALYYSM